MCCSVFCNLDKLYRNYEFICAIDVGDDHLVESKISMHAFVFTSFACFCLSFHVISVIVNTTFLAQVRGNTIFFLQRT